MNTILARHIKRIRTTVSSLEESLFYINQSIQTINTGISLLGGEQTNFRIPTRSEIINNLAEETGFDGSTDEDLENFNRKKKNIDEDLQSVITWLEGVKNSLQPLEKSLDEIMAYIRIGQKYISLYRQLANLLNALIKGLKGALIPLVGIFASGKAIETLSSNIGKIEAWVEQTLEMIDVWIKWVENFVDTTLNVIYGIFSDIYKFIGALIIRIQSVQEFIKSLSLDLLKALLGINPKSTDEIISDYNNIIENNPDPTPEDQPITNGDTEYIEEIISNNDGSGDLPPDYYEGINLDQITRLKFILQKQRTKDIQKTNEYREEFLKSIPFEKILDDLNNIREQISNGISSLSQDDIEYLSLLRQYGIILELEPELEKAYSLDQQISSLERTEAELRRRAIQQSTNENIRTDAEYEEYGKNRNNAVTTYSRKTL